MPEYIRRRKRLSFDPLLESQRMQISWTFKLLLFPVGMNYFWMYGPVINETVDYNLGGNNDRKNIKV